MKKIISLFQRNYDTDRKVRNEVTQGAEWVTSGEGIATRKYDGMAVLIMNGIVYRRYDAKAGRTPPENFIPCEPAPDLNTGHWAGWVLAQGNDAERIFDCIAWGRLNLVDDGELADGTYEACHPKIGTRHGANPENLDHPILVKHGADVIENCPRDFDGIKNFLSDKNIEGIVWHHEDGRMAKIKKSDFGY